MVIVLPSALQQNTSAHIRIDDSLSGVQVGLFRAVPLIKNTLHIGSPAIDTILRKTGRYNVTIEMDDTIGKTSFTVVPSSPRQILVTLPKLLLKDIPYTLTPQLVDEYNNSIDLSK